LFAIIGTALGESLAAARRESSDELAGEVRKLWATLAELQVTIAALARVGITAKAEPLLPALPHERDLN
jgi:hypothetical protein